MSKAYPRKSIKLDVTKLDKALFFKGKKGTYADLTLMENADGPDDFGNDGFVSQSVSKEARERGEKGPIVGNWKHIGQRPEQRQERPPSRTAQPVRDLRREPKPQEYNAALDSKEEEEDGSGLPF